MTLPTLIGFDFKFVADQKIALDSNLTASNGYHLQRWLDKRNPNAQKHAMHFVYKMSKRTFY